MAFAMGSFFHTINQKKKKGRLTMSETKNLPQNQVPWEDYADEHILYLRPADSEVDPSAFECLRVNGCKSGLVELLHTVIFVEDYLTTYDRYQSRLDSILSGFGYGGLDDLVCETAVERPELKYKEDGSIDRWNSPGYVVDLRMLAVLICESKEGELMPADLAAAEVLRLTGEDDAEFIHNMTI